MNWDPRPFLHATEAGFICPKCGADCTREDAERGRCRPCRVAWDNETVRMYAEKKEDERCQP